MNLNIIKELQSQSDLKMEYKYEEFDWCLNDRGKAGIGNRELAYSIRVSSVKSDEIRKFYLNKYLIDSLKTDEDLKLSDFDIDSFEVDEIKKILKIKEMIINIENIKSKEIVNFCLSKIDKKNKETSIILLKIIKNIINDPNRVYILNFNSFATLNPVYQLNIMIYTFSSSLKLYSINNLKEIFKQFSSNKPNLLELINKMIEINNYDNLDYILTNKESKLNSIEYEKLKNYALRLRLFEIVRIIIKFESHDFILCDD
jgi:hypothetical protein